ncbi:hypothetical protein [Cellulomonas denverensis]|uniref:hypothetical protein n=1 Tax=Cellulomonas denverensis TaxID=264297 RepID=UPI0035E5DD6E
MALLPRLRRLLGRPASTSRVGARRPGSSRHGDVPQEDALRAALGDDPNDERAFAALAEIVRQHAVTGTGDDPLTADAEDTGPDGAPADPDARRRPARRPGRTPARRRPGRLGAG